MKYRFDNSQQNYGAEEHDPGPFSQDKITNGTSLANNPVYRSQIGHSKQTQTFTRKKQVSKEFQVIKCRIFLGIPGNVISLGMLKKQVLEFEAWQNQ